MWLRILRESLPVLPTPSTLYDIPGGLGDALVGGVVDGVALALASGFGAADGGWRGRTGAVDVKEVPRPAIKCCQYLSSIAKWTHVLSALVFPTPDMMSWRLWTMDFLLVCSTPQHCLLWLHHAVRSLVGIYSSELRATFPINVSYHVAICFLMWGISKNFFPTVSFVMCWYFTSAILMPNIHRILWCRNTSSFLGVISRAPRSYIPIVIDWWEWRGR